MNNVFQNGIRISQPGFLDPAKESNDVPQRQKKESFFLIVVSLDAPFWAQPWNCGRILDLGTDRFLLPHHDCGKFQVKCAATKIW